MLPHCPLFELCTSKHCPDKTSPRLPQGSAGPPGTQGPAGTKVQPQHRRVQPGRGKRRLARYGGWREGSAPRRFEMEGETSPVRLGPLPDPAGPGEERGRSRDCGGCWVGVVGLRRALSSQGDPGEPGSSIRVSTCTLPTSTCLAPLNHPTHPRSCPALLPHTLAQGQPRSPLCQRCAMSLL